MSGDAGATQRPNHSRGVGGSAPGPAGTPAPPDGNGTPTLTVEHAAYLSAHAVDLELAQELGVRSIASVEELPAEWRRGLGRHVPGIVLPWTSHDGRVSPQLRPDEPFVTSSGDTMKYAFQPGVAPVLWAVRHDAHASKALIVEGSKQCLVAAKYAPPGVAVYGIAGCWAYSHDGVPIRDLEVVDGRDVVVLFDADAGSNLDVYTAGVRLAEALRSENAASVAWVRLAAGRHAGLDDVLAERRPERRADFLARLITGAKPKVADARPKAKRKIKQAAVHGSTDRPLVEVDDDRLVVITSIVKHLIARLDGTELFNRSGVLSRLDGEVMRPITSVGDSHDLIAEAMMPVIKVEENDYRHCWPDRPTVEAVLSRAREFTPLDRITHVPFIRPDGTVCAEPGYDATTATMLLGSPALDSVVVPDAPTPEQVGAAVELLMGEWLGDMAFPDEASRAGALALMLTPFIRGLVYLAPLAVVDGLQMGVGKNLLADCLSILTTGRVCDPKPFSADDDENRKALLGSFRSGEELIVWDEAHTLQGANLARAITAITYSDRVLGVSRNESFPNRCTWVALGNQVRVHGDITRRVYRIEIVNRRPPAGYRHPELRAWTIEHRAELVSACLTLVRAWFVAGRPAPTAPSFPSFEQWHHTVGGVLAHAQVPGFLGNVAAWREESDPISQWWEAHLVWLRERFETDEFTCAAVRSMALGDPGQYQAPLNLDDVTAKGYAKALGEAYSRIKNRRYGGLWLFKVGAGHRGVTKWMVCSDEEGPTPGVEVAPVAEKAAVSSTDPQVTAAVSVPPTGITPAHAGKTSTTGAGADSATDRSLPVPPGPSVVFDLETCSAAELHADRDGFVRLGGYTVGDEVVLTTDFAGLTQRLAGAERVIGHNIMAFDLAALARYHGLDLQALVRRDGVFDTLLAARHVDPPMAKEKGRDFERRYDLDSLVKKYVDPEAGKSHDLKALAKKHGGFDQIPIDDEEYRTYLTADVAINKLLYAKLAEEVGDDAYLRREHRVAAVAAQISLNGFLVDTELLGVRIREGEERVAHALRQLHERFGVPLLDAKGEPYAAPLATKAGKLALVEFLRGQGVTNFWTTGKTEDIATSAEAMRELGRQYVDSKPEVADLCRLVIAVVTTRSVYHTVQAAMVGERVHPSVTMKQSTGRWSLTKPGLTVLGKRGGRFREREVLRAEPGHVIIACDLAQVDMRAIAGLSGDVGYIELLRSGDPHAEIAKALFGTAAQREEAKKIGHGWNYGRGIKGICDTYDLSPELVRRFDASMHERFPRLVEWREEVRAQAGSGELLDNGWGRRMRPDPTRSHTQGPALMGQGCARDIMMEGLLRLPPEVLPYLRAQVHDEIVLSVPAPDAVEIQRAVVDALSFDWEGPGGTVPIVAEGGPTDRESWGAVYAK